MHLFPAGGLLEIVAKDIVEPYPKIVQGSHYIIFITDH